MQTVPITKGKSRSEAIKMIYKRSLIQNILGSGPLSSGPLSSGPLSSGPLSSGPLSSGPLIDSPLSNELPLSHHHLPLERRTRQVSTAPVSNANIEQATPTTRTVTTNQQPINIIVTPASDPAPTPFDAAPTLSSTPTPTPIIETPAPIVAPPTPAPVITAPAPSQSPPATKPTATLDPLPVTPAVTTLPQNNFASPTTKASPVASFKSVANKTPMHSVENKYSTSASAANHPDTTHPLSTGGVIAASVAGGFVCVFIFCIIFVYRKYNCKKSDDSGTDCASNVPSFMHSYYRPNQSLNSPSPNFKQSVRNSVASEELYSGKTEEAHGALSFSKFNASQYFTQRFSSVRYTKTPDALKNRRLSSEFLDNQNSIHFTSSALYEKENESDYLKSNDIAENTENCDDSSAAVDQPFRSHSQHSNYFEQDRKVTSGYDQSIVSSQYSQDTGTPERNLFSEYSQF